MQGLMRISGIAVVASSFLSTAATAQVSPELTVNTGERTAHIMQRFRANVGSHSHPTKLTSVPIGSMLMRISSPRASVKSSGGTIPVPVSKKHPWGKELSR